MLTTHTTHASAHKNGVCLNCVLHGKRARGIMFSRWHTTGLFFYECDRVYRIQILFSFFFFFFSSFHHSIFHSFHYTSTTPGYVRACVSVNVSALTRSLANSHVYVRSCVVVHVYYFLLLLLAVAVEIDARHSHAKEYEILLKSHLKYTMLKRIE